MSTSLFLRIASALAIIHSILHTIGGVLSKPKNGAAEIAIIDAMKSRTFNVMGSMRTYWDFFHGYAWIIAITLLVQGILFWQLSTIARTKAVELRPILLLFCFNFLATAVIAWKYFFIAPAITELLIAALLAGAYFSAVSTRHSHQ